jgi:hypothetical protein
MGNIECIAVIFYHLFYIINLKHVCHEFDFFFKIEVKYMLLVET